jgi:hypothetical protein
MNKAWGIDNSTITLLPRTTHDVLPRESASDASAPLDSLYDPLSGFSGGPSALTASAFANDSRPARQSTILQSTSTARPYPGSKISSPGEGTAAPDSKPHIPAELAYPQWIGQADTNIKMRQSARGPSQQLINPTFYGAEADGQQ